MGRFNMSAQLPKPMLVILVAAVLLLNKDRNPEDDSFVSVR
jgi:hypothetical protein